MARQPVSTQVQGNNLAVTAAPVDTMVQPTAPTGGQILLQQLANIDSGIKGIIGGVQQLSQTRLNQEVFELEQNKRIEAEAARLKNAEAQAAKEAEAARKAMLKKSHEDELEIAKQQLALSVGSGDTSQVGSIISKLGSTGNNDGARNIATAAGKIISAEVKAQINARTQVMSDKERMSFDVVGESKRLYNEVAKNYGFTPDALKYVPAEIVQDMMEIPTSAQNDVLSQLAEGKNKNDEAAEKLKNDQRVNEGAAKALENTGSVSADFTVDMAEAEMNGNSTIARSVHEFHFNKAIKSMDDLVAGVRDGSVSPEVALTKLKEIRKEANAEVPYMDGKNITIASFGNGKFSDAYTSAITKVDSIKAGNTTKATINDIGLGSELAVLQQLANNGNDVEVGESLERIKNNPYLANATPEEKKLVDERVNKAITSLAAQQKLKAIDTNGVLQALNKGDNRALEDSSSKTIKSSVVLVAPVRFDPGAVANDVRKLRATVGTTIKGNEAASEYLSDTFRTQPINTPENFTKYAQVLTVLHNTDGEMFKQVTSKGGDPRAAQMFQVSKAVESMGGGVEEAMAAYKTLTSYSDINGEAAKSMESMVNGTYNKMIADDEYPFAIDDYSTKALVKEAIRANIIMKVPSQYIPNTVYKQVNSMYKTNLQGTLSSANDGFGDEETRKEYLDPKNLLDVASLIVTEQTSNRLKSKNNSMDSAVEASISKWDEQLKDKYIGLVVTEVDGVSYLKGILRRKGIFSDSSEDVIENVRDNTGAFLTYRTKDSAKFYLQQQAKRNKESAFRNPEKAIELISPSVPQ